jgi:hypothetical protein
MASMVTATPKSNGCLGNKYFFKKELALLRHTQCGTVRLFWNVSQRRTVDFVAQSIETTKTHDEWPPLVRIDMVSGAVNDEFFFNVSAYDSDLECPATRLLGRAVSEMDERSPRRLRVEWDTHRCGEPQPTLILKP